MSYCDFYSVTDFSPKTLPHALQAEMDLSGTDFAIRNLYIGGGTPTMLSAGFGRPLSWPAHTFSLCTDCEITIEANPDDITEDKLVFSQVPRGKQAEYGRQSFEEMNCDSERRHTAAALKRHCLRKESRFTNFGIPIHVRPAGADR